NPLAQYGCHFGRTVHAFYDVHTLLVRGVKISVDGATTNFDSKIPPNEQREYNLYRQLLSMVPDLEACLINGSESEIMCIAHMASTHDSGGVALITLDDVKSMKGNILEWITPPGVTLRARLDPSVKKTRGFGHAVTGALLCPAHLDWSDPYVQEELRTSGPVGVANAAEHWPIFIYQNYFYDPDNVWEGLFRSSLLVTAYRHIFQNPRTQHYVQRVQGEARVTLPSIAYVATQILHSLSSFPSFSRYDALLASQGFYQSILDLFDDFEQECQGLLDWWNQ
ncbi:hypothetical protein FPV67DRAFT_1429091, partial [Lyophyllum atratum]